MNIHIISQPRSGSKSLERAILNAVNPLTYENGAPLGEYLNGFGAHGAKFSPTEVVPFANRDLSDVVFETNPNFYDYEKRLVNYMPKYDEKADSMKWVRANYCWDFTNTYFERLVKELRTAAKFSTKDIVIKTQAADILHCTWNRLTEKNIQAWMTSATSQIKAKPLLLVRNDVVSWICSSYLAKSNGVYAKGEALTSLIESDTKWEIPLFFVRQQYQLYRTHLEIIHDTMETNPECPVINTELLNDPKTIQRLQDYLGLELKIEDDREYDTMSYSTRITNYEWLCEVVSNYF